MSQKPKLTVAFCDYKAAKFAVMNWHYSKAMPTPPLIKIGVWENGVFIGCVLFGRGANKNLGRFVGLGDTEVCELVRVALSNHLSTVSKIISICIKLLKKKSPKLRLIVSYADRNQSHDGVIYQAGNWVYNGETPNSYLYKDKNGRLWHQRQVSKSGYKPQYGEIRAVPKIDDCEKILQLSKHRYLYPLDRAMRKQIEPLAKPYPKRADG